MDIEQEKIKLITVREVAEMLKKTPLTIMKKYVVNKGMGFPKPLPLGRKYYFRLDEINEWIINRQKRFNELPKEEKIRMTKPNNAILRYNRAVAEGWRIHPKQRDKRLKKKNV